MAPAGASTPMSQATVGDQEAMYSTSGCRPLRLTEMFVPLELPLSDTLPVTPEPLTAWKVLVADPPSPGLPLHSARSATKREQEARTKVDSRMRRIAISFRERAASAADDVFLVRRVYQSRTNEEETILINS